MNNNTLYWSHTMEKTFSYYTTDEKFLKYLEEKWDGSFTKFVNCVKEKEFNLMKRNRFKSFFDKNITSVLTLGIGAILMVFSMYIFNFFVMLSALLLGGFLVTYSIFSILLEVLDVWKTS